MKNKHNIKVELREAFDFSEVSCWTVTGERQTTRIRGLYLKTVLRQDIAFFDEETNTGEVIGRISGDTILLQDAMGEKVPTYHMLMHAATCKRSILMCFSLIRLGDFCSL